MGAKILINGYWMNLPVYAEQWGEYVKRPIRIKAVKMSHPFIIDTLEGTMNGDAGDYLIIGIKGEMYPCKPDIFEASYDAVPPLQELDYGTGGFSSVGGTG